MKKIFLFYILLTLSNVTMKSFSIDYNNLTPVALESDIYAVNCFAQDSLGFVWIGTNQGLCRYDGYKVHRCYTHGASSNIQIQSLALYNDRWMLIGSDRGIMVYDIVNDEYLDKRLFSKEIVRVLYIDGKNLWAGSNDGIRLYDIEKDLLNDKSSYAQGKAFLLGIPIYSIACLGDDLYIGTISDLYRYIKSDNKIEVIDLGIERAFVAAIATDEKNDCIWINGGCLMKYDLRTEQATIIDSSLFIKTLIIDYDGRIVTGSNRGITVFNPVDGSFESYSHDVRKPSSPTNNVIVSLFVDCYDNVFIGTNQGLSIAEKGKMIRFVSESEFTDIISGNQISCIIRDNNGAHLLGGDNGLMLIDNKINEGNKVKAEDIRPGSLHRSHRIRNIFRNRDGKFIIGTDAGLLTMDDKYNLNRRNLTSKNMQSRANWTYSIAQDSDGNLWFGTYMCGVLKTDNESFFKSETSVADTVFNTGNGLKSNYIWQLEYDAVDDCIWVLLYQDGLDRIDCKTSKVRHIDISDYTGGLFPTAILCDSQSNLWVGFCGGLVKISSSTEEKEMIKFEKNEGTFISSLAEVENDIWASTSDGLWIVNKYSGRNRYLLFDDMMFTSLYYDSLENNVYGAGISGYSIIDENLARTNSYPLKPAISRILVNGVDYKFPDGSSGRYHKEFRLKHKQNTIDVVLANNSPGNRSQDVIWYRIEGHTEWAALKEDERTITLNRLSSGKYKLQIISKCEDDQAGGQTELMFRIKRPPLTSGIALVIYALLFFAFAFWAIWSFRTSERLKNEKIEKERALSQFKEKQNFYTDISHEFKTPLSMIIAPASKLLANGKDCPERKDIELIHSNALKINSLIHRAIEYDYDKTYHSQDLIRSDIELIDFIKTIFNMFSENNTDKSFIFNTNIPSLVIYADAVKMESIINNLVLNACKYTRPKDSIIVSIFCSENSVEIKVSDTGVGIPAKDLPYIFNRFYMSPSNSEGKEGTGIGLALVKQYVELHKGSVSVESVEGEGCTFTVSLPLKGDNYVDEHKDMEAPTISDLPLIAIVEDNQSIAEFIRDLLLNDFRCIIARNGKEGLKVCTEMLPDLIITDLIMPQMDGIKMCSKLRANTITSSIPIIVLTALEGRENEKAAAELKIDYYITKPFDTPLLLAKIKNLIEKRKELERKIRIETISTPGEIKAESQDEQFVSKMIKIIEDNIVDSELNVSKLCEMLEMSQKQVYRKSKQLLGISPVEYIRLVRLRKAALLLKQHNFNVSEVMYLVGFSNHSYFTKCFQEQFGLTPQQYKKDNSD